MTVEQGWNDADEGKAGYSYRNLFKCYLTITIPYELNCQLNWDTAVKGRRSTA